MTWQIKKQDIPLLAIGAKLIGCGGGGNLLTIQNLLLSMMKEDDTITVKTLADLEDEWVVGTGMMGSTVFYNERIPSGEEESQALQLYENSVQQKAEAVISVEIGGVNGLAPILTAFLNHLPVVDGDYMGRAFPEISMTTFHLNQNSISPLVLLAEETRTIIQRVEDIQLVSETAKDFMMKNGGNVHFAGFGAKASKVKASMIPGSLYLIFRLGKALTKELRVSEKMEEMMAVFDNSLYGKPIPIISGVVSEVSRWFESESLIGKFAVDGQSSFSNKKVEIEFRNEFISIKEKNYICTTPDLILVLDAEKLSPYNVSEIQRGLSVIILAVPAPNILRTKEMLEYVGPRNFNLAVSYQPLQGEHHDEAWN
ncbi:DUF917 domain-containing protein [Paenibacillus sp. BSR1-1]|uniref:DUF917 domain-containing protein n=1 Tax=Paenibacillus sp. BSR1-1 TaxID=3020845 RepID=UPI0025B20AE9|nr:DUF917 domain-containing protein [Paenibacillus sp. BSR1-1]MDN3015511.1 DUF917 domain-containing protein [Paenibacillus sp. BSR1-1]